MGRLPAGIGRISGRPFPTELDGHLVVDSPMWVSVIHTKLTGPDLVAEEGAQSQWHGKQGQSLHKGSDELRVGVELDSRADILVDGSRRCLSSSSESREENPKVQSDNGPGVEEAATRSSLLICWLVWPAVYGSHMMDAKLKEERQEMDRIIEMQRINTEAENLQMRMQMEANLRAELGAIPPPTHAADVVMEFKMHVGDEFSINPRGYFGGSTGMMRFVQPATVEWWRMREHLKCHGFKGNAQLYYADPAREVPEGLVLMLGPEQVDSLLLAHIGRKLCHLYIVDAENDNDGSDNDYMVNYDDDGATSGIS